MTIKVPKADFYKVLIMDKIFYPTTCRNVAELEQKLDVLVRLGARKFCINSYVKVGSLDVSIKEGEVIVVK